MQWDCLGCRCIQGSSDGPQVRDQSPTHTHVLSLLGNVDDDADVDKFDGEGPDDPDYYGEDDVAKGLLVELQKLAMQATTLAKA
jgi:hypothetical protein